MRREKDKKVNSHVAMDIDSKTQNCDAFTKPNSTQGGVSDTIQEPFEGMEFESEESAKTFYINYAKRIGFRARISRYGLSRHDNSIISRHIVCSKEGFREAKSNLNKEGKAKKRPRVNTRVGCKAMIVIRLVNSGKWIITKFEKEHNHALLAPRSKETNNGISEESRKVLYNKLYEEAMKFVEEGSVSEEIYNVALAALKEASDKVSLVKKNAAEKEILTDSGSSDHSSTSSGGSHKVASTPIKAIPISSRPSSDAPIINGTLVATTATKTPPSSLIHATAIACGARFVPPNQAISIVKAIEAKIMSGKAIVAKAPDNAHNTHNKHLCGETTGDDLSSNENGEEHD